MIAAGPGTNIESELDPMRKRVDAALAGFLPPPDRIPEILHRALHYSLFPGGKRIRPLLTLAACHALGGDETRAMPAACAIEMIHSYSLIHDDLPAMDNDDLRRGRPTSHKVFGEAIAILAGDALLSIAFQNLTRFPAGEDTTAMRLRILQVIADAASAEGIIAGQVMDLQMEGRQFDEATLERIHRSKTGALLTACVVAGAVAGGVEAARIDAFRTYGESIGLAFQIVDDLLDVEGSAESLGKTAGKDARAAKATFPALLGVDESRRRAAALVDQACAAVCDLRPGTPLLEGLARAVLNRSR
jgi:geranylgeranyl diphosphate synthase type II